MYTERRLQLYHTTTGGGASDQSNMAISASNPLPPPVTAQRAEFTSHPSRPPCNTVFLVPLRFFLQTRPRSVRPFYAGRRRVTDRWTDKHHSARSSLTVVRISFIRCSPIMSRTRPTCERGRCRTGSVQLSAAHVH